MVIGFGAYTPPLTVLLLDTLPPPYNRYNQYKWPAVHIPNVLDNYLTRTSDMMLVRYIT